MNPRHALRVMTFILCALASAPVYGANSCQSLFRSPGTPLIDGRYGRASQNSEALERAGVIDANESKLCGPTCMINALHKFHIVTNSRRADLMTDDERIIDLAKRVFPRLGVDVVHDAANVVEVARALRVTFREEGISADVTAHFVHRQERGALPVLNRRALREAVDDDKFVIVGLGLYNQINPRRAAGWNRKSGHFMLLVGHDPETRKFYFVDPLLPRQLRVATLTRVQPDEFASETFQVRFADDNFITRTILIEGMVVATLRQK